jgi:hypothetical protein
MIWRSRWTIRWMTVVLKVLIDKLIFDSLAPLMYMMVIYTDD